MWREEHSHTDMLMCSTKTEMVTTILSMIKLVTESLEDLLHQTLIYLNLPSWDTNLDMHKLTQTLLHYGRLNLVTLQMELKLLLISSFVQVKPNGM